MSAQSLVLISTPEVISLFVLKLWPLCLSFWLPDHHSSSLFCKLALCPPYHLHVGQI